MSDDLLPPNATQAERALGAAAARIGDVPVRVRDVWDPDTCPSHMLPWLGWALSVDRWDPAWPDATKREAIRTAIEVQRIKGTIGAVRLALSALDIDARVVEWHRQTSPGAPYTYKLAVEAAEGAPVASAAQLQRALRVVDRVKSLRSHLDTVEVSTRSRAGPYLAAAATTGHTITVAYDGQVPPPAIDPAAVIKPGDSAFLLKAHDFSTVFQNIQDTSTPSADGDLVGTVVDLGTGGNNLYASEPGRRPTAVQDGGYRYIKFPGPKGSENLRRGSDHSATVSGLSDFDAATYVIAFELTGGSGQTGIFRDAVFDDVALVNLGPTLIRYKDGGTATAQTTETQPETGWHILSFRKSGSEWESRFDGEMIDTVTGLPPFDVDIEHIGFLGENSSLSMCLLINRALTDAEWDGVERYAAENSPASLI